MAILAIGASAGGVEALGQFFDRMPASSGIAFVVIQHLSPDFKSLMDEILARHTSMPVLVARDGLSVLPNHVYVNAPGKEVGLRAGHLVLSDRDPNTRLVRPIDHFLRSLSETTGPAIGAIILSGTGSDGAEGLCALKQNGGLVLAQEPSSAQFDGMPLAAIATGHVDVTLAPERMPAMLLSLFFQEGIDGQRSALASNQALWPVFPMLHDAFGIDFSEYKIPTLARRTERRMKLVGCRDMNEYLERLRTTPDEVAALYGDLLIGVTSFFRDTLAFERLGSVWIPELLERLEPGEEFRAWVAGTATGEEAYSIAILVRETLDALGVEHPVRIFATDVHKNALSQASLGVYRASDLQALSDERRERYFNRDAGVFSVKPELRSMVMFAPHNVLRDVPFNRLDLVSCRNLLIYLNPAAQQRVLSTFHFALKHQGILLLGPSESLGEMGDAFQTLDTHWKVFRRQHEPQRPAHLGYAPILRPSAPPPSPPRPVVAHNDGTLQAVLEEVMPAAVLVGRKGNLVQTFGGASRFLRVPEGRATTELTQLLASDLRVAVSGALGRIFRESGPIFYRDLAVGATPEVHIDISVHAIKDRHTGQQHALIKFGEPREEAPQRTPISPDQMTRERLEALELELSNTRADLQVTVEALETSNEELQATNEELMASNEELQTTNEELHAVNQELFTVNTEYQKKISELTQLTLDMDHLLASTEVHTLFLDRGLCVRRFTPEMAKVFNLVNSDIGRRIDAFNHRLSRPSLYDDLKQVIASGRSLEVQVTDQRQRWYLLRALPYRRTSEQASEGAVLTLVDITSMKRLEAEARNKNDLLSNILTNSPHPVFVRDRQGKYILADESFHRLTGRDPTGLKPDEVFPEAVARMLTRDDERILDQGLSVESEDSLPTPDGQRTYLTVSFPMRDSNGGIVGIGGMQTDVTNLKRAEAQAREASDRRDRFLATLSHELRNPLAAVLNTARLLVRSDLPPHELERWHRVVLERSQHMARLVDDLLDVARLTQDKLVLQSAPLDLCQAAQGVIDEVRQRFDASQVELAVELDSTLPLLGDATRLHQLQVNLLTNAARHTPPGGRVEFRLAREGEHAEISVRDTGEGIAPDMLERIFELFVQGDQPGARGTDNGLGVGLALVRRIAELHGGNVTVASRGRGHGTEFRVRLPLSQEPTAPLAAPPPPVAVEHPGRVLVVDDDQGSREAMGSLLEMDEVEVVAAANGPMALNYLASGPDPDLILLDIGLPGMDGYEVCRQIRALPQGERLLVVALTGFGQDSDRRAAKQAGFDDHLTKPVDVDDVYVLYSTLRSAPRSHRPSA